MKSHFFSSKMIKYWQFLIFQSNIFNNLSLPCFWYTSMSAHSWWITSRAKCFPLFINYHCHFSWWLMCQDGSFGIYVPKTDVQRKMGEGSKIATNEVSQPRKDFRVKRNTEDYPALSQLPTQVYTWGNPCLNGEATCLRSYWILYSVLQQYYFHMHFKSYWARRCGAHL